MRARPPVAYRPSGPSVGGRALEEDPVRTRTWLAMAFGAAVGAGSVYLLDPDHGHARRGEVAARARRQAATQVRGAAAGASRQARAMLAEARRGFAEQRAAR